eukprot:4972928-Lingulodinium_polyedra.AAC.1
MPARGLRVTAAAHDEFQKMLTQGGCWFSKGKYKSDLRAPRFETVVARFCGCLSNWSKRLVPA